MISFILKPQFSIFSLFLIYFMSMMIVQYSVFFLFLVVPFTIIEFYLMKKFMKIHNSEGQ
jgi:hypothetical protein